MKPLDLQKEMDLAASRMRSIHFDGLKALGVPMGTLGELSAKQHTVGMATIEVQEGGLFIPSPDGKPACIVAVVWPHAFGEAGIYDLIAFRSSDPSRWWLRTGLACALGEHLLDLPDPLPVVRTPCDWLAAGGDALCILDWSDASPVWGEMRAGPDLIFSDEALRLSVRNALVGAALPPSLKAA